MTTTPARRTTTWGLALATSAAALTPTAHAATTVYEAEDATRSLGAVQSEHHGYTGTGFVNYDNVIGSSVHFTVHAATTGEHDLILRFANGTTTDRPMRIEVDDTVVHDALSFTGTGAWTNWTTRTLSTHLHAGDNTVRATATTAEGGPNLDSLTVDNGRTAPRPRDWSTAVVDSTIARRPATSLGLGYTDALFLHGTYLVYRRTGQQRYLDYLKTWGNTRVAADGSTGNPYNDLDSMLAGNVFLDLAAETGEDRYRLAAAKIHQRLETYPRTTDGGFIHNTAFTGQLWADGVFMAQPFLARYGLQHGDPDHALRDAAHQLTTYYRHLRHPDGLLHHAYDETRRSPWADPTTGRSAEVWCRAVGWFGMATTDVLELMPPDHPDRTALVDIVEHLAEGYRRWQDPATGRWFQLPTKPELAGNWTETSCSSMYAHTIARAVDLDVLGPAYLPVARRGYQGVLAKTSIGSDGRTTIADISIGTSVGDERYYLQRARAANDFHGLGAFLIMNEELGPHRGR